jgi:hypothetical protein
MTLKLSIFTNAGTVALEIAVFQFLNDVPVATSNEALFKAVAFSKDSTATFSA